MVVTNYQSTLRNIPEEGRFHFHCRLSLKTRWESYAANLTKWSWPVSQYYRHNSHYVKKCPCNLYFPQVRYVEVKVTLVQALRLCTDRTAHRWSRGVALLFHYHGTRRGWEVSVMPRPLFTTGKDPVPILQEAGWASGPVWTGAENLATTGIRSPDRPACSQSISHRVYAKMYVCFGIILLWVLLM
jgi:hypothetical protein